MRVALLLVTLAAVALARPAGEPVDLAQKAQVLQNTAAPEVQKADAKTETSNAKTEAVPDSNTKDDSMKAPAETEAKPKEEAKALNPPKAEEASKKPEQSPDQVADSTKPAPEPLEKSAEQADSNAQDKTQEVAVELEDKIPEKIESKAAEPEKKAEIKAETPKPDAKIPDEPKPEPVAQVQEIAKEAPKANIVPKAQPEADMKPAASEKISETIVKVDAPPSKDEEANKQNSDVVANAPVPQEKAIEVVDTNQANAAPANAAPAADVIVPTPEKKIDLPVLPEQAAPETAKQVEPEAEGKKNELSAPKTTEESATVKNPAVDESEAKKEAVAPAQPAQEEAGAVPAKPVEGDESLKVLPKDAVKDAKVEDNKPSTN